MSIARAEQEERTTHKFIGVKDGPADVREMDSRHADLPLHSVKGGPEGPCDDFVAKANACIGVRR